MKIKDIVKGGKVWTMIGNILTKLLFCHLEIIAILNQGEHFKKTVLLFGDKIKELHINARHGKYSIVKNLLNNICSLHKPPFNPRPNSTS